MDKIKKIIAAILDTIEIYVPCIMFFIVFCMYIVMIAYRYIFNKQIATLYEATQILYIMCAMLAASYGGRTDRHVVFPLVYDKCSPKVQTIFRMISSVIVVALAAVLFGPSYESIAFLAKRGTSILKVPYSIVYGPFIIFLGLSIVYYIVNFIKDLKLLLNKNENKEEQ